MKATAQQESQAGEKSTGVPMVVGHGFGKEIVDIGSNISDVHR
ncbi:hypothetical protein [Adhaeretor mobilis]|nr:hypothetical protein [Adhaeretor mobilis]